MTGRAERDRSAAQAVRAAWAARVKRLERDLGVDLIAGEPGRTVEVLIDDLERIATERRPRSTPGWAAAHGDVGPMTNNGFAG